MCREGGLKQWCGGFVQGGLRGSSSLRSSRYPSTFLVHGFGSTCASPWTVSDRRARTLSVAGGDLRRTHSTVPITIRGQSSLPGGMTGGGNPCFQPRGGQLTHQARVCRSNISTLDENAACLWVQALYEPLSLRLRSLLPRLRPRCLASLARALLIQSPKGDPQASMGGIRITTRVEPSFGTNSVSSKRQ